MTLKIYNTLTRKEEEFMPIHGNRVNMFVCGPTVYDYSHLGHAKTYLTFDVIVRYLRSKGYSVFYLQNVTDIDDKMITRANELNISVSELADRFFKLYLEDVKDLRITNVNLYAKATEYIPEIINQIQVLIEKGYAYESDGNIYYEVKKFEDFGKLSKQSLENLIAGARVEIDENKRNPEDFALWKAQKPGEPAWDSPWGKGRPGWHIEDTAITTAHFGPQYDIHGGATELIFPHHEAEIAQAEAFTGKKPFVRYWVHTGVLNVDGKKMSKSLGNFLTIRDLLAKYDPEVIRFFLINNHYRSPIDYNEKQLEEAKNALKRIHTTIANLKNLLEKASDEDIIPEREKEFLGRVANLRAKFIEAMDNDFNTREAIAVIFDLTREVNEFIEKNKVTHKNILQKTLDTYEEFGNILGLFQEFEKKKSEEDIESNLIILLIEARNRARHIKNYEISDFIRDELKKLGIVLEDSGSRTKWTAMK